MRGLETACYRRLMSRKVQLTTLLLVALPMAAADLWIKALAPTPWWAYHERSPWWAALCIVLLPALVAVTRIPAPLSSAAAGLLTAGVLGNVGSALANDFHVPNPFIVYGDQATIAFNLADVSAMLGIALLTGTLAVWLIRHRDELRTRETAMAFARTTWRDGDRRLP